MELKFLRDEENFIEVELVGEEHTLPNMVRDVLNQDKDVTFAAYVMEHPLVANPKLVIRTKKGSAKKALKNALKELRERIKKFESSVKT